MRSYGTFDVDSVDERNHTRKNKINLLPFIFIFLLIISPPIIIRSISSRRKKSLKEKRVILIENSIEEGIFDLCQIPRVKKICQGNRNISRGQMPQVSDAVRYQYIADKRKQGFFVNIGEIPPNKVKPVQKEIDARRVLHYIKNANDDDPCEHQIIVSTYNSDDKGGYDIIDGHHHWAACCILDGKEINAMMINDTVNNILKEFKQIPSVTYNSLFKPERHHKKHRRLERIFQPQGKRMQHR